MTESVESESTESESESAEFESADWSLARRVAVRIAGEEPYSGSFYRQGLRSDFAACTEQAEDLVAECTGLSSLSGPARGRVISRVGWIDANLASFKRLLRLITDKLGAKPDNVTAPLARRMVGIELGMMLGWMSTRVLGQYDLLIIEDEKPAEQDIVYYVAPNVLALENRYAFDPAQFRLWLALHEVTHRAQFTGVSWLRPHFLSLVETALGGMDSAPNRLADARRRVAEARRCGDDPLAAGGLVTLFASDAQLETLGQLSGMMSLLEGHGDVTMDRAAGGLIPTAARFGRVIRRRRQSVRGFTKVVQRLVGLDAKVKQYEEGERFIEHVEAVGGQELLNRVWTAPEYLPSIDEIRAPGQWVARVSH